ncbi:MAG: hypothetical protein GY810_09210 [Aureispira sp.]|nr:hypothetical protein [Aureispira sp.]
MRNLSYLSTLELRKTPISKRYKQRFISRQYLKTFIDQVNRDYKNRQ